jgi:RNA polymerase sigma-70 factor, ECF subfamily
MATLIHDLWSEHRARLRGYIAKRVREDDAVDDILQTVFLKASEKLHSLKSRGSVAAWLYRIAANAIVDHYRSRKSWEELPADIAAPESKRDYLAELASCLQPLIDDLPDPYRTALVLSEIEGLPQREVADRLHISLSGAKSRVQRGREKLRRRLLDCCAIETGRRGIIDYEPRDPDSRCGCD